MTPNILDQDFNINNYIDRQFLPDWFNLPKKYFELLNTGNPSSGDFDIGPSWQLLYGVFLHNRFLGLKERFPSQNLYPFARRVVDDDIACFDLSEESNPPKVKVIHDFCAPGWEDRGLFKDFDSWFKSAKNESEDI